MSTLVDESHDIIRTERGWPGHFIAAAYCLFRRNTLLECDQTKVVVSTVGGYRRGVNIIEIGCDRYYETLVFYGKLEGAYIDADVSSQIYFDSPWSVVTMHSSVDNDANEMHENVVAELTQKLKDGLIPPRPIKDEDERESE